MIAGIILAAGQSRRLGRPKQLLSLSGEPLIRVTVRRVLASILDQIVLVVGDDAEKIITSVADLPVRVVVNPDAASGQSTSLRAGLSALPPDTEAVVFLLGDQPEVDPCVIDALIAAWRDDRSLVIAPRYPEGMGNPILFDRQVFPELVSLEGDVGARAVVLAHQKAGDLELVSVGGHRPSDVDTESDYLALLARTKAILEEGT